MAIRNIRTEGDELLRKKSRKVEEIDDKIQELIDDMIETMHKYDGLGLAAPQVGVLKQVVVIDLYDGNGPIILINPEIKKQKGVQVVEEGCLSYPCKYGKVERPAEITVEALDRDRKKIKITGKELMAQALSHEIDHLNGELFMDKILEGSLEIINPEDMKKDNE